MSIEKLLNVQEGRIPIVATALHDGHQIREDLLPLLEISESDRLREEDPYTGHWAKAFDTYAVPLYSRFEVDLNRPRDLAVYQNPEQAWGLRVYKQPPSQDVVRTSLEKYDTCYRYFEELFKRFCRIHGKIVVLDLHTYNHRREGEHGPIADPHLNPEINLGTGNLNRTYWEPVIETFLSHMQRESFLGRKLDVRENIKFLGGHFGKWAAEKFPNSVCVLSIEFKKIFMNEWTGECDEKFHGEIKRSLQGLSQGLLKALTQVNSGSLCQ